jgi:hypothetical protein
MRTLLRATSRELYLASASVLMLGLLAFSAIASPERSVRGMYTWEAFYHPPDPELTFGPCVRIEGRLLRKIDLEYTCRHVDNTASRQKAIMCKNKHNMQYVVFKYKRQCDLERKTQEANGT